MLSSLEGATMTTSPEAFLAVASGRKTKSELHGYGQNEFVPWQLGAVM